ncbi:MAG: hypothetical protein QG602_1185, partial [Verrucomicrobiota bacterium]|nr:hypothetical protein [Verrucomicrobiota bacterium]
MDATLPDNTLPPATAFAAEIILPAATETAGLGPLNPDHRADRLTAVRRIEGAVWYEREFTVPETWRGRPVVLFLERTKWCRVWLDGRPVGECALLCVPHKHPLGVLAPGTHRLALHVDNRRKPAPGDNHQTSEHTQGNWNGVLGAIELRATSPLRIAHVGVVPDVAARAFHLTVRLESSTECSSYEHLQAAPEPDGGTKHDANVRLTNIGPGSETRFLGKVMVTCGDREVGTPAAQEVKLTLQAGPDAALWDEFSPALHRISVRLESPQGNDEHVVTTGLREFRRAGTQFAINGRVAFLRGEVNCAVFPETGHTPMVVAAWRRYFQILRAHGMNHVRFHSWTPPEAAFTAADELGFYVATELPFWGEWTPAIADALAPEGEAILRAYGH